ncbi:hypothetical protein [Streptomyces sp. NPDC051211]|uniref:hypothetical protein n=1 Tax=Streptomyces sp. NPDC051211 TaxID=3154643 RepID=UPI003450121B
MSTSFDLDVGTALVSKALVDYGRKPDSTTVSRLTDDLLTYGESLLAHVVGLEAAATALKDWHSITQQGPSDNALGNWDYLRALARTVRRFHNAMGVCHTSYGAPYIGRPGFSPIAPATDP